ncbi:MAG: ArsR/SmtB family transcription factor [Candidatus Methanomethylophilaceae archaeon]
MFRLSEFFSLFGDSTRLKILIALEAGEMCVCDIGASLGISDSAVSHHLKALKTSRLIKSRRKGKFVYYSLCDDQVRSIIDLASEHLTEAKNEGLFHNREPRVRRMRSEDGKKISGIGGSDRPL